MILPLCPFKGELSLVNVSSLLFKYSHPNDQVTERALHVIVDAEMIDRRLLTLPA